MIIAPENFKDEEYYIPKNIFEANNFNVVTASTILSARSFAGKIQKVDVLVSDANAKNYDAVIFVGGPGASIYFNDKKAHELAKNAKTICAICIAPSTLANAGILKGKKATCWPSEKGNLENNGAIYTNEAVVVDGDLITANGPGAAKQFGETIVKKLKERD